MGNIIAHPSHTARAESFDPHATLSVMAEEHVSAVPGAPPMYQAWLAMADRIARTAAFKATNGA